jgi:glycosyltransferase involved in cell wall biosynthesis
MTYVAFWTGSTDGSSYYRADLPSQALGWQGHRTFVGEILPASVLSGAEVIIGSRIAGPEVSQTWAQLAQDDGKRLIMDLDDDYFHVEPRNRQAAAFWNNDQMQWRLIQNCLLADVVTCASEGIAEAVRRAVRAAGVLADAVGPEIVVIPNGLHAGYLAKPKEYETDVITFGWAGTSSSAHDFDLIAQPLARILEYTNRREDGFGKAYLVGMPGNHPGLEALARAMPVKGDREMVNGVEWVPHGPEYLEAVSAFDIWLASYRSSQFTEAKFPTKALEAGILGIPLIVSDIRPYREWITHGENGFLVHPDRPWEWGRYLKTLVDAPGLRRQMGEAARSRAAFNTMQSLGLLWEQVLTP